MRILADDAIPFLKEAFEPFGEVVAVHARNIDNKTVHDADVLLVRTVTRVDERLLAGSKVRFVGTATAGIDHVDAGFLGRAGIVLADAAGCNAQAVADWVLTALHILASRVDAGLLTSPVGVVGFGRVGRRLAWCLRALGCTVLAYDPPLQARVAAGELAADDPLDVFAARERYVELAELLGRCRTLTLHVPYYERGPHPTRHLVGSDVLANVRPGTLVVNTSRGGVIDDGALEGWLRDRRGHAALDVWEGEPMLRPSLVGQVDLASPHVAGYSVEGKVAGTAMIHEALARWLGRPPSFDAAARLGPPIKLSADLATAKDELAAFARLLSAACPIERDHAAVRMVAGRSMGDRPTAFEAMRRGYPFRRELASCDATDAMASASEGLRDRARVLGMRV